MLKRAQFFLLAAVIISTVILSLGITSNWARVSHEPKGFYDFSYEVKRETGAVADYVIYTDVDGGKLEEFVVLLAKDIKDRDPDSEFLFIYGDSSNMTLKNYGAKSATVGGEEAPGGGSLFINKICMGSKCQSIDMPIYEYRGDIGTKKFNKTELESLGNEIIVEIEGYEFPFLISEHKQVIFIMQKDVEDESFITVE